MSGEQKIWGNEACRFGGGDLRTPPLGSLGQSGVAKISSFVLTLFFLFFFFYFFGFRHLKDSLPVSFRIPRQVARSQDV
jgi:hypothetical protein